MHIIFTQAVP